MGDYAASGGYYISCAADWIVAEPTTLTGSIGIFGLVPNAEGLLKDKLGLNFDVVKTNELADLGDLTRPFNEEEKARECKVWSIKDMNSLPNVVPTAEKMNIEDIKKDS